MTMRTYETFGMLSLASAIHSTKVKTRDTSGACEEIMTSFSNKPKYECIKCASNMVAPVVTALYTKGGDYIQKSADMKNSGLHN